MTMSNIAYGNIKYVLIGALICCICISLLWCALSSPYALNDQIRIHMRFHSFKLNEYYERYNRYPMGTYIYNYRGNRDDAQGKWYESLKMIDPESIREGIGLNSYPKYYSFFGQLADPPLRQWSFIYNSTTDSCILIMPGWDGEMEIDMINIDMTDVQKYNGRDWSEFQYDPSNGLKSRGDYIVVCHKGKTVYKP